MPAAALAALDQFQNTSGHWDPCLYYTIIPVQLVDTFARKKT
jgi:hypothetical protein